jgi:hypothetical protein
MPCFEHRLKVELAETWGTLAQGESGWM